jgi:hypothetical protein
MSSGQRPLLNFQQGGAPCAQPARGRPRASLGVMLGYAGVIAPDVDTEDTVQLAAICAAVPASPVAKAGRANGGRVVACPPPPQPSPLGRGSPPRYRTLPVTACASNARKKKSVQRPKPIDRQRRVPREAANNAWLARASKGSPSGLSLEALASRSLSSQPDRAGQAHDYGRGGSAGSRRGSGQSSKGAPPMSKGERLAAAATSRER